MNKWQKVLIVVVLATAALILGRNMLIGGLVSMGVKQVLGTPVKIKSLSVGLFRPVIEMKGLKIYNPPGFPNTPFIDVEHVRVEYDLGAILKKQLHLKHVILNLNEVVLVKDKDGKLNADSLKFAADDGKPKETEAAKSEAMPMQIDLLELDLGKVVMKDFSKGEPPSVLVYDVGVHDKKYKDVRSAQALTALVLMEALGPTGLKSAGIYGAASVLGVAFLPAGVAGVMMGNDSGTAEFKAAPQKVFEAAKQVLASAGRMVSANAESGKIVGTVEGANIVVTIMKKSDDTTTVKVTARKYVMPRPELAQGVLYQIGQKIK